MGARTARKQRTVFVGDKIRRLRKERSLTQAELAQRIGVQQSDLCRMENGEYRVSLDALFRILGVFGLEIGEFFREEFPRPSPTQGDRELLALFHRLDDARKREVLEFVRFKADRSTSRWQR